MMKSHNDLFFELYDSEQFDNVIRLYETKISDSDDSELKFFYALALFKVGNYSKSTTIYNELLLTDPKPETYFNITINQILSGTVEEGMSTYNQLLEVCKMQNINYINYKIYVAHALINKHEVEKAKILIQELNKEMLPYQEMDTHHIYIHQLPFYSDYLHCVKQYFNSIPKEEARLEIKLIAKNLNQYNYEKLSEYSKDVLEETLPDYELMLQNKQDDLNNTENKSFKSCSIWLLAFVFVIIFIIWKCSS